MFSKSANPECGRAFDYRPGQFFRYHKSQEEGNPGANAHAVQHFWLRDVCRARYFLAYRESASILIHARLDEHQCHHTKRVVAAA